jgi:mono/diheme cytochrome c family protein
MSLDPRNVKRRPGMPRVIPILAVLVLAAGFVPASAQTQPTPFRAGDARAGKAMVDRDCVSCHAQRFAGDADQIYRRTDRKVRTPAQLLAQVQGCNVNLGKGYFPEEEEHIAAYLNLHYYKFKP